MSKNQKAVDGKCFCAIENIFSDDLFLKIYESTSYDVFGLISQESSDYLLHQYSGDIFFALFNDYFSDTPLKDY
jgi:hypothetical protein